MGYFHQQATYRRKCLVSYSNQKHIVSVSTVRQAKPAAHNTPACAAWIGRSAHHSLTIHHGIEQGQRASSRAQSDPRSLQIRCMNDTPSLSSAYLAGFPSYRHTSRSTTPAQPCDVGVDIDCSTAERISDDPLHDQCLEHRAHLLQSHLHMAHGEYCKNTPPAGKVS